MTWKLSQFRAGDMVEIRSKGEILATLDQHGCFDNLPFMPEMLQYCGQRFRVDSVAHKTCDTARQTWKGRRLQTTVHLAGLRCDGGAHGGCQAACSLFWKDVWLKAADAAPRISSPVVATGAKDLRAEFSEANLLSNTRRSLNGANDQYYVCQATQMYEATEDLPWWNLRQYWFDIVTGNSSAGRVLRVTLAALIRWSHSRVRLGYKLSKLYQCFSGPLYRLVAGRPVPALHGRIAQGERTPTGKLDLQPGEFVRVKSQADIEQTLDVSGKNRGLSFDPEEMAPYCGRVFKVKTCVTKIIDEPTGQMIHMKQPCIVLEGALCSGEFASCRLMCPRAIPAYWRELWLERVNP